ncbi:TlpA family protein disulfide reductase [Ferrimonas balearica]|uniref:TlpA family protein disulfide reductase n=1 Tax=Ferrimonas balearica TaxID=44012 RepID=UPI001C55EC7F|nr:TlpA disulfide reductase family protein [Ferrimonas balearica]MBW3139067.1 TlpA family protein disulfide reductase [Ferrimonas balearica]
MLKQGVILVVILGLAIWGGGWLRGLAMTPVGEPAPHAIVAGWEGGSQALPQAGQRQLLYLFAPWCQICDLTIDHVDALRESGRAVHLVALSFEDRAEVAEFLDGHPELGPVWLGNNQLARDYQVPAFPAYVIVDEEGSVLARRVGYLPGWALRLYLAWYGV